MIFIAASSVRRRSSRVSSKPSIPGIIRSVMTQSGRSTGISFSACPLEALMTTAWPARFSTFCTSARIPGSSSTT